MIRKARKKDLKTISQLLKKAYAEPPYKEKWTDKNALLRVEEDFENGVIFILDINKEIVGFITIEIKISEKDKKGYIADFAINKKFRGKDYGRMLYDKIEDYFKKKGIKKMELMASNESKAFKIYKKWGFEVLEDFIYMTKKLK
jgi:ribosomal protein S18 acetylase RimI-like enzyme